MYPRLLLLAERAWHKAGWESQDEVEPAQGEDWYDMANTLGYKELQRLDQLGISYHIPPPGARYAHQLPHPAARSQVRTSATTSRRQEPDAYVRLLVTVA